jgi:hypothetical protein
MIVWPDYCRLAGLKIDDLPMWKVVEKELELIAASFSVATQNRLRFVSEKRKFRGVPAVLIMLHRVLPQENITKHVMDLFFIEPTPEFDQLRIIKAAALSELAEDLRYNENNVIEDAASVRFAFEALAGSNNFTTHVLSLVQREGE